ncbi:MAG: glycosyltransferase [Rhodospirillales bacterium]|nr:glycosyltransferase [Rhodospirillales bacterium]
MQIILFDDTIPFDGSSPDERPLGGAEKAFARLASALAARGHEVSAINRCEAQANINGVNWLPWDAPRPPETDVLIAFRKPELLEEVENARYRCLWVWDAPGRLSSAPIRELLAKIHPALVFTGEAHLDNWKPIGGISAVSIVPGVSEPYLVAADSDAAPDMTAIVTTHPLHGLSDFIRLWRTRIHPKRPEAWLQIYSAGLWRGLESGDVDKRLDPIMNEVRAAITDGIEIRPPLPDGGMAARFRDARVHFYPIIRGEIYSSTLAESQATGLPAVIFGQGDPSQALVERFENGRSAYLAPDEDAFVNLTLDLLGSESELYQSLSAGKSPARGWDAAAIEFEALWK